MNRYRAGGPSKASATTKCQKCLKLGHYSYECTAAQQERPYISRPSRTQQLLNPKLAPKITEAVPEPRPEAKTITSKRGREDISAPRDRDSKRRRSVSTHSSNSVSTISTNRSRSQSPPKRTRSPPPKRHERRRRDSSVDARNGRRNSADRGERSALRSRRDSNAGRRSPSPVRQERITRRRSRSRSRSPYRASSNKNGDRDPSDARRDRDNSPPRERSLSPYSRRMAMTRAANGN